MRRVITLILLMCLVVFLQSCTINWDFEFHKDNTISSTFEVKMKSDSLGNLNSNNKKFPKEWTNFYDLALQEGKNVPADSVDILKRISAKELYKGEKSIGFAVHFDRIADKEWKQFGKSEKPEEKMISSIKESSTDWDGKTLTINVEELIGSNSDDEAKSSKKSKKKSEDDLGEQMGTAMLKAFDIQINLSFKFETPITSIKGKHKYFRKIDEKTAQFNFNLKDEMSEDSKKKKYDKKIIITTE